MKRTLLRGVRIVGTAALAAIVVACGSPQSEGGAAQSSLTVKGSDTMVHLVSAWAEAYMNDHPEADIAITGGGSGTGIKALINGTTDIAAASRDMTAEEVDAAKKAGHDPNSVTVARDGIAIVVNPQNPIGELTLEQLHKVYNGQVTNWNQIDGPDLPIVALSRESSSGTYVFFQEHVLKKEDYAATVRPLPATAGIIQSVSQDQGAIGYVGLGYAAGAKDKVKIVNVKADDASPAVVPSEETVKSGESSISRPLYLVVAGQPTGIAKDFVDFALSDAGQQIVRENEYITVK